MKRERKRPEVRKDEVLTAALILAEKSHYLKVTRDAIAAASGVSGPAVQYHFKTMGQLRKEIMRAAVKRHCLLVIAQGVLARDAIARRAPEAVRRAAVEAAL